MISCPNCQSSDTTKSGILNERQRYKCKNCNYHFTVLKQGKKIDNRFITKSLQLYLEGLSFREIERLMDISHVTVSNCVKKYQVKRPEKTKCLEAFSLVNTSELSNFIQDKKNFKNGGIILNKIGEKYMIIHWKKKAK